MFALGADDYGIAPGVGTAVRELAGHGRISATSCMVTGRHWEDEAPLLADVAKPGAPFEVGLHLVLSDQTPLGEMPRLAPEGRLLPLPKVLGLAVTRRLDAGEVAAEVDRQIDRFEEVWNAPPAFVDGHQHVHQFPVIRNVLLDVYERRLRRHGTRVRYCTRPLADILRAGVDVPRAFVVSALGVAWARAGRTARIPGNRHFAGVRSAGQNRPYGELLRAWLATARPGTLVMCHPGLVDADLTAVDPMTTSREGEYGFLSGDGFPALLDELGMTLVTPSRLCEA